MKIKDRLTPLFTVALVIVIWFITAAAIGKDIILPSPQKAWGELLLALKSPLFWKSVGNTTLRAVVSFIIAFVLAFAFSLLCAKVQTVYKLFYPLVVILRALPTISVIFICYLAIKGWFRAVLISFLVIFPTLFASFYTAIMGCSQELKDVTAVYRVAKKHALTRFIIPSIWQSMYSEIVNSISLTVKLIIAAEAVTSTAQSLGGLMAEAKATFEMTAIYAYTIAAVILSYATEIAVRLTSKIVGEVGRKCRLH